MFAILKYRTYRSPGGIYELEYPRNWKLLREENILNICPRDEIGAVTISAYSFESKTNEEIIKLLRDQFESTNRKINIDMKILGQQAAFQFKFFDNMTNRSWMVIAKRHNKDFVLATVNSTEEDMEHRRIEYIRILNRLTLKGNNHP